MIEKSPDVEKPQAVIGTRTSATMFAQTLLTLASIKRSCVGRGDPSCARVPCHIAEALDRATHAPLWSRVSTARQLCSKCLDINVSHRPKQVADMPVQGDLQKVRIDANFPPP